MAAATGGEDFHNNNNSNNNNNNNNNNNHNNNNNNNGQSTPEVPRKKPVGSIEQICDRICDEAGKSFRKQSRLTRDEKLLYEKRFSEIFRHVFLSNAGTILQPTEAKTPTTKDTGEMDLEKKNLISECLVPQLDDAVLKTVQKRKELPKVCVRNMKTYASNEVSYLNSVQIVTAATPELSPPCVSFPSAEVCDSVAESLKLLSSLSKQTVRDYGRLVNLDRVRRVMEDVKKSTANELIFKTDDCPVPTAKHGHKEENPNPDKRRRLSPRFKSRAN